jgi:hypothetical protein
MAERANVMSQIQAAAFEFASCGICLARGACLSAFNIERCGNKVDYKSFDRASAGSVATMPREAALWLKAASKSKLQCRRAPFHILQIPFAGAKEQRPNAEVIIIQDDEYRRTSAEAIRE